MEQIKAINNENTRINLNSSNPYVYTKWLNGYLHDYDCPTVVHISFYQPALVPSRSIIVPKRDEENIASWAFNIINYWRWLFYVSQRPLGSYIKVFCLFLASNAPIMQQPTQHIRPSRSPTVHSSPGAYNLPHRSWYEFCLPGVSIFVFYRCVRTEMGNEMIMLMMMMSRLR